VILWAVYFHVVSFQELGLLLARPRRAAFSGLAKTADWVERPKRSDRDVSAGLAEGFDLSPTLFRRGLKAEGFSITCPYQSGRNQE
jgi:hypothetical protein